MLFMLVAKVETEFNAFVEQSFGGENSIQVGPGQWLIHTAEPTTAKDVWDRIVSGRAPSGLIVSFSGYYGRLPSAVWEWIAAKRASQSS
jgi:hypothetical protein